MGVLLAPKHPLSILLYPSLSPGVLCGPLPSGFQVGSAKGRSQRALESGKGGGSFPALIPTLLGQHWLAASLHLPSGYLLATYLLATKWLSPSGHVVVWPCHSLALLSC